MKYSLLILHHTLSMSYIGIPVILNSFVVSVRGKKIWISVQCKQLTTLATVI